MGELWAKVMGKNEVLMGTLLGNTLETWGMT
jgi:hypothetical protein